MTKFKTYFMSLTVEQRDLFARRCVTKNGPTSRQHLTNIAYGYKPCGIDLAINIDRETGGVVRCEDLRPDVDWAHVRNPEYKIADGLLKTHGLPAISKDFK